MHFRLLLTVVFLGACGFLWAQDSERTAVTLAYDLKRVNADTVAVSIKITDKDGKPFAGLKEEPAFTIFDESGKKLAVGKFQFG